MQGTHPADVWVKPWRQRLQTKPLDEFKALAQFWRLLAALEGKLVIFTQVFELSTNPIAQEVQAFALPVTQEVQGNWHCTQVLLVVKNEPGKHERQRLLEQVIQIPGHGRQKKLLVR